jgi:hypothetical protein
MEAIEERPELQLMQRVRSFSNHSVLAVTELNQSP